MWALLIIVLYGVFDVSLETLFKKRERARRRDRRSGYPFRSKRCYPHGVLGRCRRCEEEATARVKAEAEARAQAERRRMKIEETYKNIDAAKRDELTALVKERAKRELLFIGPGDLEAAVVRMYKKYEIKGN